MNEPHPTNGPILGRYQVLSELAKSRIGGLVMALDVPEKRAVALRSFPVEARFDAETTAQLVEAGAWVKGLDDPSVMTPLEIGTQEGVLHTAYSYVIAEPLRAILRLAAFKGIAFPVGVALRIAYDVTLGARAIEACGVPPRVGGSLCGALLPDSILVGQDGRTRLCDTGIAAVLRRERSVADHADVIAYAAPEQVHSPEPADGRADVFTIGVFLWEMLANRRLFAAHDAGRPREFTVPALESVARPSDDPIPASVVALVKRALEPAVADRLQGSTALLRAIESDCRDALAPSEAVQAFMGELVGNLFESRARAIECAIAAAGRESLSVPPPSVRAPRDAGLRAAAPKNKVVLDNVNERAPSVSNFNDPKADGNAVESASPDATITDSLGEPGASVPAPKSSAPSRLPSLPPPPVPPKSVRPAPVFASKPPLSAALPALPKQFELPGAELFATPGLPAVRAEAAPESAKIAPPADAPSASSSDEVVASNVDASAAASSTSDDDNASVNPVGPTIPAPPLLESNSTKAVAIAGELQAPAPLGAKGVELAAAPVRRPFKITWGAWMSIILCAFIGGVAARRCARPAPTVAPSRVEAATFVTDASVDATPASSAAVAIAETKPDAGTKAAESPEAPEVDGGAPVASAAPPVKKTSAPKSQSLRAPKYNSKVSKGTGKTTHR